MNIFNIANLHPVEIEIKWKVGCVCLQKNIPAIGFENELKNR